MHAITINHLESRHSDDRFQPVPKDPPSSTSPPSDADLFRAAVGKVRRLKDDRTPPHRVARAPRPQSQNGTETVPFPVPERDAEWARSDGGSHHTDIVDYHRPGIQTRTLKRLRQGRLPPEAHLDLHGKTTREAEPNLYRFIARCSDADLRCLRIVHGKGISSPGGRPVLKARVVIWLREHPDVIAFCSAQPADGGTGAMYVLLRARGQ